LALPPAPFLLRTLGPLVLERTGDAGSAAVVQRGGKPLALLAYLVVEGARPIARTALADLFWGDESPESARASLRQALHALRKLLGEGVLVGSRTEVMLAPGQVESDHARFVAAVVDGDMQTAIDWYRGPFCHQVELRSATGFDRWVDAERERLRRLLLRSAEREVDARRASGDLKGSARLARSVQSVEATLPEATELFADALIADGDRDEAHRLLETHRSRLHAAGEDAPAGIESRLAGLDRATSARVATADARATAVDLGQRFVGRDEVIAALFRQLAAARGGRTAHVVVVGPPGIGKSRVLDEFDARIRPRGTRIARIRFLPAMRAIPGSALAEFARALCALPGAMGVSESTAGSLVALLPELRAQFPSAPAPASSESERSRTAAIADLVAAVSEDRLTVLMRDDDHNVDPLSRAVLDGVLRREDLRLLDVRTSRDRMTDGRTDREEILLKPLSPEEVQRLFESIGAFPDAPWVESAIDRLTARTAGIPQLLLQRVRSLGDRGALRLHGEQWTVEDPSAFVAPPPGGDELEQAVGGLHPSARLTLALLAHWRRPMKENDLRAVLCAYDPTRPAGEWGSALAELELRGLTAVRDEGWVVAHETIADSCLDAQAHAEAEQMQFLLVRHWSTPGALTVPVLEHLALLCGARDLRNVAATLVRVGSREPGLRDLGLRGKALARRVASSAGRPDWEADLYAAIGWLRRRSRGSLIGLGSLAGIAAAVLFWLGWMLVPRLVIESEPMAEGGGGEPRPNAAVFVVQPRVGIYNGFGRRLEGHRGTVHVRGANRTLDGDTIVAVAGGQAQFTRLVITGVPGGMPLDSGDAELVFSGSGLVRGVRTRVRGGWLANVDAFRVVRVSVNGTLVDSGTPVAVPMGDTLRVVLTFEFSSTIATANYVVGAAPLWMPRERATIRLAGLPRPVRNAWQTVHFSVPPSWQAGRSHLVILMGLDDSVEHLFSLTQWTAGVPRWNDGNDVHDLSEAALRDLREGGRTFAQQVQRDYQGSQRDVQIGPVLLRSPASPGLRVGERPLIGTAVAIDFIGAGLAR